MFRAKRKRRRRRSEVRLGAQSIRYETTATRPALTFLPVLRFWQLRGAKICGVVVLAVVGWIIYSLFSTPAFFVYNAEIDGNAALSNREIYAASGVDSQSIFWIDPEQVAAQITALPNIKSAGVSVALPDRVAFEVVERRPQLLWQTGESIWWVHAEVTIVPPRTKTEEMLKIIDDDMQPMEAGYQVDLNIIKGAQALRLLAPDVSVIRHTRAQGLIVATPEGWPVYLGDGSQMRAKLVVLSTLLPDLRAEENPPMYIDLRNPLRPVYKLRPVFRIETITPQQFPRPVYPAPRLLQPPPRQP